MLNFDLKNVENSSKIVNDKFINVIIYVFVEIIVKKCKFLIIKNRNVQIFLITSENQYTST